MVHSLPHFGQPEQVIDWVVRRVVQEDANRSMEKLENGTLDLGILPLLTDRICEHSCSGATPPQHNHQMSSLFGYREHYKNPLLWDANESF